MAVFDIFSKRKNAAERASKPDVYKYDQIPDALRRQIVHIWCDAIGNYQVEPLSRVRFLPAKIWDSVHAALCREYGVFSLGSGYRDAFATCQQFLLSQDTPVDGVLDIIEFTFRVINTVIRAEAEKPGTSLSLQQAPDDAIEELNTRFREHAVGYQFEQNRIVRTDSELIHSSAVIPALSLLADPAFSGPNDEFLQAHEHYRRGENRDAIVDALNAFESTMKTLAGLNGWDLPKRATAKQLIAVMIENGLIPKYLESHFAGVRSTLEGGLPTVRNKTSGHGQGATPVDIPGYFAGYALHLAAANIKFLVDAHSSGNQKP